MSLVLHGAQRHQADEPGVVADLEPEPVKRVPAKAAALPEPPAVKAGGDPP